MEQRIAWDDLPRPLKQAIEARTAAEIDHHIAGFHGRDSERIAAAESEIGTFRHGREFLIGIANIPGLCVQVAHRRGRVATRCRRRRRAA